MGYGTDKKSPTINAHNFFCNAIYFIMYHISRNLQSESFDFLPDVWYYEIMEQRKKTFTGVAGTALLTTALLFPGCDLAKPKNKRPENELTAETVEPLPIAPIPTAPKTTTPVIKELPPRTPAQALPKPEPKPLELPPGWTQEKYQTLMQLREEMRYLPQNMRGDLANIDPMLVGRHVVFGPNWLPFIGDGKPLTKQQFEAWRNKTDIMYDRYVDLTGTIPLKGEKVFINLRDKDYFKQSTIGAHAHGNTICFNINASFGGIHGRLKEVAERNSWNHTMMHELAHVFATGRKWEVDTEGITDVLVSYLLETTPGAHYGTPGRPGALGATAGTAHRNRFYNRALNQFKTGKIDSPTACELYLNGLVDKVGWDVYKQVFRSYNDKNFELNKNLRSDKNVLARSFFDRLEHFSGNSGVLRTLPDKGALLDKYFNVPMAQQNLQPTMPTVSDVSNIRQMQYVQPAQNEVGR
jgi:hypothetical protein